MADKATATTAGATRTGGCLCGAVRFTARLKTAEDGSVAADVCHCGMCRRWHGGPALAVETLEPPRLEGEDAIGVYKGSDWGERGFCKICGSSLFWRLQDQSHTNLPAGVLDDQTGLTLAVEIFVDDQPDFYRFAGERKRMTGAEVVALFTGDG